MSSILIDHGVTGIISSDGNTARVIRDEAYDRESKLQNALCEAREETKTKMQEQFLAEKVRQKEIWGTLEVSFNSFLQDVENRISHQLIEMSIRVAEIIIRHDLPDHSMLQTIIRETLEPISDLQGATVRMHPEEARAIEDLRSDETTHSNEHISIISDDSLSKGDVLIESRNGYFDGRITERLKMLDEILKERYKSSLSNDDTRNIKH